MASSILEARGGSLVPPVAQRGYHIPYREHETNYCPGCGRTHWYIGRIMAECAFCGTALPLENAPLVAGGQIIRQIVTAPAGDHVDTAVFSEALANYDLIVAFDPDTERAIM
jgi:hypothetical protein